MKFAATTLLLAAAIGAAKAADTQRLNGRAVSALRKVSRRLDEEDNQEEEEEDEFSFLTNYDLTFVQCAAGQKVAGDDSYEYSSVVYRLCPAGVTSKSVFGCSDDEAYGDYVVGINTYTQAIAQAMQQAKEEYCENYGCDDEEDEFNLEEYAECREADLEMEEEEEENEDRKRKLDEEYAEYYFIGPQCSSDGMDIELGFFSDETCTTTSETSFYELVGSSLPYSEGGLSGGKTSCYTKNDDGDVEAAEICTEMFESVAIRCDAMYDSGCSTIQELNSSLKRGGAGKAFLVILIVGAIGAGAYYFVQQKKKNQDQPGSNGGFFSSLT